jgi:NADPH:quinone reductase-like Zn-dependent oxidoreductase
MDAWIIDAFGGIDRMQLVDLPTAPPGEGEVLVRIKAVGVNPVDWKIREGRLAGMIPHEFPLVLGWDMAGVVEEPGYGARRFMPGDEVYAYARRPVIKHGTYAEYITLPESYLSLKPSGITMEEAAAVPLVTLTAAQSLFGAGRLQTGETVLIIGASGGVGSSAVQLAKLAGARVVAMASKPNHAYLRSLGAGEVLSYTDEAFTKTVNNRFSQGVDMVFDCFGGESLNQSIDCLKPGGRVISITGEADRNRLKARSAAFEFVFVEPNAAQLDHFRDLIHQGRFKSNVSRVFPFSEAVSAHQQMETGHTRGKIVLRI